MARGNWTKHTVDSQEELLRLLQEAGGKESVAGLYRRGAWGIRTQTVKALIRKGAIICNGTDIWNDELRLSPDVQSTNAHGEKTKPLVGAAQQEKE